MTNALVAVGCVPECPNCKTTARGLATVTLEVLDDLEDEMTLTGAHLTAIRGERYGHPSENFKTIAGLWSSVIGTDVTAAQVGLCMILVKVARLATTPDDQDSIQDLAGYAACLEMLAGREPSV